MREPAERAEPVVDRHHHNAAFGQRAAVIDRIAARPAGQRAAVDPHEHRRILRILRRPDVERQAVLAHRRQVPGIRSEEHTSELQSLMCISYAVFCLKTKNTEYLIRRLHHNTTYHTPRMIYL